MAGGPIYPSSVYVGGASGNLFPNFYAGGGANASPHDEGVGVVGSLAADSTVELRFPMPPTLPTGTIKLRALALANATSGVAKFTVKDGRVAAASSPSAATLTSETQSSITWTAADVYNEVKVSLTGVGSLAGNDMLVCAVTFNTTGWTLTITSTWLLSIIWE